jgi:hypothetical protein
MPPLVLALIGALALLNSPTAPPQSKEHPADDLVARLSYGSTYFWDQNQDRSPQICFALYRDGYYRLSRKSRSAPDGTESLQGTLSSDQLARIRTLLKNLDVETGEVGAIRKASESFIAEVVRDGKTVHSVWIDPDHERPFPDSAIRVVNWLQDFEDQGSSPLTLHELSDRPICPSASEKPLHPVIASLDGTSRGSLCESRTAAIGTSAR